ncbi:purinergic receptor P2X 7 [Homo sapiens]|uniref:Purinergic receptor P2X 7 n=1 Tax=Homo sapiens TaxID=9606 RepID=F5H2X6_HUMAN|nr:purinergic receptor P2X 7 [Homo sapiens]KAI2568374.1 purinergic receptor P2X 7 [Homo sapiens]KAI4068620.1 purinergic receptor P2X 7 [Homo sapiens]KAI4068621.1 purinergic receptor P2X 7 [Homo sapiens]
MPACCSCSDVFQYETNKVTRIQSMNYGTIKWFFHVIIFSYVCFALVSDKLYQRKEPVISSVHTKVKGIAEVKEEIVENGVKKLVHSVFDTADYTFPLQLFRRTATKPARSAEIQKDRELSTKEHQPF